MPKRSMVYVRALLGASALIAPGLAQAQSVREMQMMDRLEKLEAEVARLRADLATARQDQATTAAGWQAATQKSDATAAKVAALESRAGADGMKSGSTTIKIGGFIKLHASHSRYSDGEVASNSFGRDFYLPQTLPTGGGRPSEVSDFSAKQSRFWVNFGTDVAGHAVKGYLETDFQTAPGTQGSQRTTNGYDLALRRAFLQLDRWTFGQDWSTFQYVGALPESTDFVGGAEGTVFVRQPLIRYSAPLSKSMTLHVAIENPESGTASAGAPALVENGDDRLPDFTARLAWSGKIGELSLAGLLREVRADNAGAVASTTGYGVSAAGKIFLNTARSADVRFMATYGHNAGRYIGLNFAPDAILDPASATLRDVNEFAALAAVRVPLTPQLRLNVMGSYQSVDYDGALTAASIASFSDQAWSAAANIFYSPVKNIDLGVEYRHGERRLVSGAQGQIDRIDFAAKYGF